MKPRGFSETKVTNYRSTLRNIPEERLSQHTILVFAFEDWHTAFGHQCVRYYLEQILRRGRWENPREN